MFLGIEIGGTKLQLVTGDNAGRITERCRLSVDTAHGAAGIRAQIEAALPQLCQQPAITAVGVGFGGPVNWRTGRIACSHQIEGWSEFDLADWLGKLTGAPVFADNDANVAALGEAWLGAGVGFNPMFYTTLGSGVGGGLVLDGTIYHGATPGESELGHVRLDRTGTTLESRCSGWAVDARIRESNRQNPLSLLSRQCGNTVGGEARHLGAALEQGDADARRILEEAAADLAYGLSHVVHLFHPAVIILGGGLSHVGEPLRVAVQTALTLQVMEVFQPGPPIRLAALGEDAVPVGALRLAALGCSK
ncbi:MAG: ROK family protein [Verrucomicrobia bacterium]|nr:ROK family protein [Verrucomicrobiota bacterium]